MVNIRSVLEQERLADLDPRPSVEAAPETPLLEVVRRMQKRRCGCAVIVKSGRVEGVFTERDLILKVLSKGMSFSSPVKDVMVPKPHVLSPEDSVAKAVDLISKYQHRSIPLTDKDGRFVSLISVRSLIAFLAEHFPTEVYNLPPRFESRDETPEGG